MTQCSNCGSNEVFWSENLRLNSKGEMKHWLMNTNGTDHKCMNWTNQGGRDAVIPSVWSRTELEWFRRESSPEGRIHQNNLRALEALLRSPYIKEMEEQILNQQGKSLLEKQEQSKL